MKNAIFFICFLVASAAQAQSLPTKLYCLIGQALGSPHESYVTDIFVELYPDRVNTKAIPGGGRNQLSAGEFSFQPYGKGRYLVNLAVLSPTKAKLAQSSLVINLELSPNFRLMTQTPNESWEKGGMEKFGRISLECYDKPIGSGFR